MTSEHAVAMSAGPDVSFCPLMPTYAAPTVQFVRGEGSWLHDVHGGRYLDLLSGLAVTSLGHSHPEVAAAIAAQASTLLHVSNLYGNEHQGPLAASIDELVGGGLVPAGGQVFFTNSGAEANECAIKLARKFGGRGRHTVVSAFGSFHGRTLATLHATGQPQKHEAFQPLPEGFRHVAWCEADAMADAVDDSVAAVLLEPVQGEGGVHPATTEYFRAVRRICDERGALFMVDEVQTGLGRTGRWFAHQHFDVRPDVITLAKALGNGMPIGACWARRDVSAVFEPGDHGTTFGGQPLAASAARAVLAVMRASDVCGRAERAGRRICDVLERRPDVAEVRGLGLLLGVELLGHDAKAVAADLLRRGVIVNAVTPTALRLAPSLLISDDELDLALVTIGAALDAAGAAA